MEHMNLEEFKNISNTEIIQELIKVNHISEELMKEVKKKKKKKYIGYKDRNILEELYNKIKDSLNMWTLVYLLIFAFINLNAVVASITTFTP